MGVFSRNRDDTVGLGKPVIRGIMVEMTRKGGSLVQKPLANNLFNQGLEAGSQEGDTEVRM